MIRAIVIASVSVGTIAQTSDTGLATCQCLGALPATTPDIDCEFSWAFNGKCIKTVNLESNWTTYPADYGESCKVHKEPGAASCFDLTQSPPVELNASLQADWCNQNWCYVDPCSCDAPDAAISDYFTARLFYSYATCGEENTYTASEGNSAVGSGFCMDPAGLSTCKCIGKLPKKDIDCDYSWNYNGKCVETDGLDFNTYPADYGESCKIHKEPGQPSCFDLKKSPPVEIVESEQGSWCMQSWCYIDPCNCNAADPAKSDYFLDEPKGDAPAEPFPLYYSYTTCGAEDSYVASSSALEALDAIDCTTTAAPSEVNDAHSLKMCLGLLLAGMSAFA